MTAMIVCGELTIQLEIGPAVADLTPALRKWLDQHPVQNGSLQLMVVGSTASLTTLEFEPGAVEDLKRLLEELAPRDRDYAHERTWQDGNGHSHVQAALLGPSLSIPVRGGKLALGAWQQVVIINHDIRSRERSVLLTLLAS